MHMNSSVFSMQLMPNKEIKYFVISNYALKNNQLTFLQSDLLIEETERKYIKKLAACDIPIMHYLLSEYVDQALLHYIRSYGKTVCVMQ